eukprot:1686340-Prymnesium_polylepis.3
MARQRALAVRGSCAASRAKTTCLSQRVYALWPDAPAVERNALRPMLELLTSAAGRQQLISEMDAQQAAEDVVFFNADATPWIDELQQSHDCDDVAALVMALDDLPRRHAGSFTRNDDLELICKVQRVHQSEGQQTAKGYHRRRSRIGRWLPTSRPGAS